MGDDPIPSRRPILAAAGSVLAGGCLGSDILGTPGTHTPTVTVEVGETDDRVGFDVERLNGFDADEPARLRIALTNETGEDATFLMGPHPPFSGLFSESVDTDSRVVVLPEVEFHADVLPDEPSEGCWSAEGQIETLGVESNVDLDPGEKVERTYVLASDHEAEDCLPDGEYRFRDEIELESEDDWIVVAFDLTLRD